MKAEQAYGPDGNKRNNEERKLRLTKKHAEGPIGFGQVLGMVRRDGRGGQGKGKNGGEDGALLDGSARHSGTFGIELAGNVPSALVLDAQIVANGGVDPNVAEVASPATIAEARDLTSMNPAEAMRLVVDEAKRMKLVGDLRKELRLELEPAHLGPIVIRLMVDRNQIRTELSAREERAAKVLAEGTEILREKLSALGFTNAEVTARHNPDDFA